jgi:hypothetical protein
MQDDLEIHVPISPTTNFFNRVHYLAAALKRRGGPLSESRIIVTVGADQEAVDVSSHQPWSRQYPIRWRWLERTLFARHSFFGTALARFREPFQARNVLMLDAGVLIHREFTDLIQSLDREGCLHAMPALASPWFEYWDQQSHEQWWQSVFDAASLGPVPYVCQHTCWGVLWGPDTPRLSPPYFNCAVLAAPAETMAQIGTVIFEHMRAVERVKDFIYKYQIALSLSVVSLNLRYRKLPIRYNMPNHAIIAEYFTDEVRDARILHYLNSSSKDFQKDVDMDTPESVGNWLVRPLEGERIDLLLRQSFAEIHPDVLQSRLLASMEHSPNESSTYAQLYENWHFTMTHRFEGYVDCVQNGEMAGWVFDRNHPEIPAVVTISSDGVPPIKALACQYRADVAVAYGTPGLHGFRVLLPGGGPAHAAEISVTCEDGHPLGNGAFPLRFERRQASLGERRDGPCLIFMHIQKTAGIAFRDAILANFSGAETALIYPDPPGFPRWQLKLMPDEQRRSLQCVMGHIGVGIHENFSQPFEYVTIVRDPVKRVISNYQHMCRNRSPPAVLPEGGFTPLEKLLESGASIELDNLITRYFSGTEGHCLGGLVNQEWFELALANLRRFRFIGHQEKSDASWAELCRLYGWSRGVLRKVNVGDVSPLEVSARTLAAIADYNRYDIMLYREIVGTGCGWRGADDGAFGDGRSRTATG